ncbi:MAG: DUF2231 domain-containing protein [Bradymonadaceae bacterium]|nr:DUF2231 domain-containing protein [Lujinxingiaceae bacterium]
MAMRLQEIHPALSHYPIALIPVSVIADALGTLTDNRSLLEVGRITMPIAAASAALTAVAGLVAQESVKTHGDARDMLTTHRNLNIGALAVTTAMAIWRFGRRKPGAAYLALGAATIGTLVYSAYLGGHMVYARGVGVPQADGLRLDEAPEVRLGNAGHVARTTGRHIREGVRHSVENLRSGPRLPTLHPEQEASEEDLRLQPRAGYDAGEHA